MSRILPPVARWWLLAVLALTAVLGLPLHAGAVPTIEVAPGASPAGYLPLSSLGIDAIPSVGDDVIINFDTPTFLYAGQVWNRVGFSSNGYLVVGGSTTAADNTLTNQLLPDATAPNNVLAPFWTDLNPAAAGALRVGLFTAGADTWIVFDWAGVPEFSSARNLHSFEVWIGVNNDAHPVEDITFAYGTNTGSGNGGFLTVGAEDITGTIGDTAYFNGTGALPTTGTELRVTTRGLSVTQVPFPPTLLLVAVAGAIAGVVKRRRQASPSGTSQRL